MKSALFALIALVGAPGVAGFAVSVDSGAALVMPTGLEGQTETVGPNMTLNLGYQMKDFLRLDLGAVVGAASDARSAGFQGLRPAAKLFPFAGSLYGKASLPLSLSGGTKLGLLVGGGYELKLLGIAGGFVEVATGYEGAAGGVVPMEARAGLVFVW